MDQAEAAKRLTDAVIDEAMARAERVVCSPLGADRCFAFPEAGEEARKTCTPQGRCKVGWLWTNRGPASWDAWLDVATGEGRLRRTS